MLSIDLNCDMGEGQPNDSAIMPYISSANIACGYHAGDIETMMRTIESALKYNVSIGAHPSFFDKENFGRINMNLSPEEIYKIVFEQISALAGTAEKFHAKLHHVKPHGALYNMAAKDIGLALAVCQAIKDFDESLILYGLSGSRLIDAAKETNLKSYNEVFADRTYQTDGSLTSRSLQNALITDSDVSLQQVLKMIKQSTVISVTGDEIPIVAETICIHGDGEHAVEFAKKIYYKLKKENIAISA
ncbi:MAG: LamB/YcsF family protein [Bacteroidetes bacterium]|nr:LamB/YcsF family protein [Bacteroidota bacterium]